MTTKPLGYRNTSGRRLDRPERSTNATFARLWHRLASLMRTRKISVIQGVRYEELDAVPLRRSLARGMGKRYRVRFPSGAKMIIEVSGQRPIADLLGVGDLGEFSVIDPLMRPGDRVLLLHAGTGHGVAWLSDRLGPTGALVALESDPTSVRYARHRYNPANSSLEVCGLSANGVPPPALTGELDGAFDGIIHRRLAGSRPQDIEQLAECWRLLAPGGVLAVFFASPSGHHDPREDPRLSDLENALKALAFDAPPGIERMERVRVHARCGILLERSYGDDEPLPRHRDDDVGDDGLDSAWSG